MSNNKLLIALIVMASFFSGMSYASCQFKNEPGYMTTGLISTVSISATLSVPADTPVGAEIYRHKIAYSNKGILQIDCTETGQFMTSYKYLTTPLPLSSYGRGVYETGLPGIGIKFVRGNGLADFPTTVLSTNCVASEHCFYEDGWSADSRILFIKTANTVTPGTISVNNLPSVVYSFGQSGSMRNIYKISLIGNLKITTPTCDISPASQAMSVDMGQHYTDTFTGKGSVTQWKDASIQLTNCGQFYGNTPNGYLAKTYNGTASTAAVMQQNVLSISLNPLNGVVDAAKGIMKIDNASDRATGIGIQLSRSKNTSDLVNLADKSSQKIAQDGPTSITVPLFARYIQTENNVLAGKANSKLEYTITYQ